MSKALRLNSRVWILILLVSISLGYFFSRAKPDASTNLTIQVPKESPKSAFPSQNSKTPAAPSDLVAETPRPSSMPQFSPSTSNRRPDITPPLPAWVSSVNNDQNHKKRDQEGERDNPSKLNEILTRVKTGFGESAPSYPANYQRIELEKALRNQPELRSSSTTYTERGPANVPGRTRALWIDPQHPDSIWIAASAGGGIWRTTNGGKNWNNQTPDLSNLTICALAASPANPNIIYAGTGETVFSAQAEGDGILKSIDRGLTWSFLPSTLNHPTLQNVTRIAINPQNPNHLVVAANPDQSASRESGDIANVMISKNGGASWTPSNLSLTQGQTIDQIIAAPDDFNRQYITVKKHGIYRSLDAGETWSSITPKGLPPSIERIELAIAPQNSSIIYASIDGKLGGFFDLGTSGLLLKSYDAGNSWIFLLQESGRRPVDFLNQGFWNKTLMVSPLADSVFYFGGVDLWKITTLSRDTLISLREAYFVNAQKRYTTSELAVTPGFALDTLAQKNTIEIQFGAGQTQKAHLFIDNAPPAFPTFLKMVDVPWQIFDHKTGKQLAMALLSDSTGAVNQFAQIYLTNLPYSLDPNDALTQEPLAFLKNATYQINFAFGPIGEIGLNTFIDSTLKIPTSFFIEHFASPAKVQRTSYLVDSYGAAPEPDLMKNSWAPLQGGVHPDQHALLAIVDSSQQKFKLLVGNDGGVFVSNLAQDPGINNGDFSWRGYSYNTAQFYGADKRKNADHYLGGTQDNGAWVFTGGMSSDSSLKADAKTSFWPLPSGDGFEVLWNKKRSNAIIWSSQFNDFRKLEDFRNNQPLPATKGLQNIGPYESPFISRLANTDTDPETVYAVGKSGVWISTDFGSTWNNNTPFDLSLVMPDVDVSRANPAIVWAADGLGELADVWLSTDGALSFQSLPTPYNIGFSTSVTADLVDPNTAYLTFSASNRPKLMRTRDLGKTWQDLSGFDPQSTGRGFPNVATFCMVAMPHDPKIIWVGTEIGVVATEDDGATWHIIPEIPKSPIFNLKIVDDQVVISTWGRGIWTATIPALANVPTPQVVLSPLITATQPLLRYDQATTQVRLNLRSEYDSTLVLLKGVQYSWIKANETQLALTYPLKFNTDSALTTTLQLIAYKNGQPLPGPIKPILFIPFQLPKRSLATGFETITPRMLFNDGLSVQNSPGFNGQSLQSGHPYPAAAEQNKIERNFQSMLTIPIVVTTNGDLSYRDVALVEPADSNAVFPSTEFYDYVIVEGSKNLVDWVPLAPGYDAKYNDLWLNAFNLGTIPDSTLFIEHDLSFFPHFKVGDTIVLRFRLYSDAYTNGWGWLLDDLNIQIDPLTSTQSALPIRLKLYPNPVQDQLYLELADLTQTTPFNLRIVNASGQVSKQLSNWQPGTPIDVQHLPKGVYTLELKTNNRSGVLRFVKM